MTKINRKQPMNAAAPRERVFLFLQGPHGPFFNRLGKMLRLAGAQVWRVGFNAGDRAFWFHPRSYIPFRGQPEDWPETFTKLVAAHGITDIVLYGDTRPVHAAAVMAAILFVVLALVFDSRPFDFSEATGFGLGALAFWGAATGGLAPVIWYNGVRKAPGALTAGAMAVMPLSALALSYLLLGEAFRWIHLAGFGLVFAGLVLMIVENVRGAKQG